MQRRFQFRLRSLFLLLTLAAVALAIGNRISNLRKRRDYHRMMSIPTFQHFLINADDPDEQKRVADEMESLWKEREHHDALADEYDRATWRPWMIVDEHESPHGDGARKRRQ